MFPDVSTNKSSGTSLSLNCDQYIVPDSLKDLNIDLEKSYSLEEHPNCSTNNNELLQSNSIFPVPTTSNEKYISSGNENSFRNKITTWAVAEQITHKSLNKLLQILKTHSCHSDLPSDSRTLLNTPRTTVIKEVYPGYYWHNSLESGILEFLKYKDHLINGTIELVINIDGLPISKSSGSQLWPILGSVFGFKDVFIVGIYHGNSKKPESANLFLERLVEESKHVIENGIFFNNKKISCMIKLICADAPAKSFILNVKGHTGYSSCTKCWDEGEYCERRICFSDKAGKERTDHEFFLKSDDNYHLGASALDEIPFLGLVTNVPLDYLHLICLGVVKKLIHLWFCDSLKVRLQFRKIKIISNLLKNNIHPYVPLEFQRKPRALECFKQWKGTEFRQFLLYSGPVVLKNVLSNEIYNHFMTLHVAITILSSNNLCADAPNLLYAHQLLQHFVTSFKTIYGHHHISHNVHGLLHIVQDVRNFGSLDMFSTFKFENFMQKIKKLLRKDDKPLQQIARRIYEITCFREEETTSFVYNDNISLKNPHTNGPLINSCSDFQFSTLLFKNMTFKTQMKANNVCGLTSGKIVIIENIICSKINNESYIIGKEFFKKEPLYTEPCVSSHLGIYMVSNLSMRKTWPLNNINTKYFLCEINLECYAAFPLLHIDNEERPNL